MLCLQSRCHVVVLFLGVVVGRILSDNGKFMNGHVTLGDTCKSSYLESIADLWQVIEPQIRKIQLRLGAPSETKPNEKGVSCFRKQVTFSGQLAKQLITMQVDHEVTTFQRQDIRIAPPSKY